jgi:hypothetical protein
VIDVQADAYQSTRQQNAVALHGGRPNESIDHPTCSPIGGAETHLDPSGSAYERVRASRHAGTRRFGPSQDHADRQSQQSSAGLYALAPWLAGPEGDAPCARVIKAGPTETPDRRNTRRESCRLNTHYPQASGLIPGEALLTLEPHD